MTPIFFVGPMHRWMVRHTARVLGQGRTVSVARIVHNPTIWYFLCSTLIPHTSLEFFQAVIRKFHGGLLQMFLYVNFRRRKTLPDWLFVEYLCGRHGPHETFTSMARDMVLVMRRSTFHRRLRFTETLRN